MLIYVHAPRRRRSMFIQRWVFAAHSLTAEKGCSCRSLANAICYFRKSPIESYVHFTTREAVPLRSGGKERMCFTPYVFCAACQTKADILPPILSRAVIVCLFIGLDEYHPIRTTISRINFSYCVFSSCYGYGQIRSFRTIPT